MATGGVQRPLDHTPRQGTIGVRDYAILMLVARLGLRSIEVARLLLDDVDWRCGEIVVRGKGRREDRLPLPADVGEAQVTYLPGPRPRLNARHVFLTCRAPYGPIRADLVGDVVERDCWRAALPKVAGLVQFGEQAIVLTHVLLRSLFLRIAPAAAGGGLCGTGPHPVRVCCNCWTVTVSCPGRM